MSRPSGGATPVADSDGRDATPCLLTAPNRLHTDGRVTARDVPPVDFLLSRKVECREAPSDHPGDPRVRAQASDGVDPRGAVAIVPTAQADRECCHGHAGMGAWMGRHLGGVHVCLTTAGVARRNEHPRAVGVVTQPHPISPTAPLAGRASPAPGPGSGRAIDRRLEQHRAAIRADVRLIERRNEWLADEVEEQNSLCYRVVRLRRPQFSWTRMKGESDVEGGGGMVGSRRVKGAGSARTEGARRATGVSADGAAVGSGALAPGQRWSASRKRDVVLRPLRGESLDAVSREVGLEVYRLEAWKARALAGIELGLKAQAGEPLAAELDAAKRHIGGAVDGERAAAGACPRSGASPPFGDAEVVAQGPHIAQCGWNEALQRGHSPVHSRGRRIGMQATKLPVEVDDAIVLLLGAPSDSLPRHGRIDGITRLEKLIFLVEHETDLRTLLTEHADFEAYNFGPFSGKVYQAVDTLVAAGLLEDSAELASSREDSWEAEKVVGAQPADPYATRNFALTDRGRKYYEALIAELPPLTEKLGRTVQE